MAGLPRTAPTLSRMSRSSRADLTAFRRVLCAEHTEVAVSDLDGVLRRFDPTLWTDLADLTGLPAPTVFGAILGSPALHDVVRGRVTHAQWRARATRDMRAEGASSAAAQRAVEIWATTPATVDREVQGVLDDARDHGMAVFVFTNGTDRVRAEIEELGLSAQVGADGTHLLNSVDFGAAKPEQRAYAAAHASIEHVLGRRVEHRAVVFLDDSPSHVRGAEAFGWRAVLHRAD